MGQFRLMNYRAVTRAGCYWIPPFIAETLICFSYSQYSHFISNSGVRGGEGDQRKELNVEVGTERVEWRRGNMLNKVIQLEASSD